MKVDIPIGCTLPDMAITILLCVAVRSHSNAQNGVSEAESQQE